MGSFLDKAKKVGEYAIDKTGDVVEIGKYKAKITSQKSEISKLQKEIGKYYYEKYSQGEDIDDGILEYCKGIDAAKEHIAQYEEAIQKAKSDAKDE